MIKFRDKNFPQYFIDPVTAIITNDKCEVQEVKINKKGRPCFNCMEIHKIQAHTHYDYEKGMDIHHIDENKMNNSLENLVYLTHSEHSKIHHKGEKNGMFGKTPWNKGKTLSEETKQKISEAKKGKKHPLFGTKFKWINDGIQNRRCPLDEEIPEGFVKGKLKWKK